MTLKKRNLKEESKWFSETFSKALKCIKIHESQTVSFILPAHHGNAISLYQQSKIEEGSGWYCDERGRNKQLEIFASIGEK